MTEAVNLGLGLYVDPQGDTYPVAVMFDSDGDECDCAAAVSAVAGTEGRWYVLDLANFGAGAFQ